MNFYYIYIYIIKNNYLRIYNYYIYNFIHIYNYLIMLIKINVSGT